MDLSEFPALAADEGFAITSPPDKSYNCVAWAADDDSRWWEPGCLDAYWPANALHENSVAGLATAFESLGYEECSTADHEPGYEKVALYGTGNDEYTHAAKQVGLNRWSSKIGELEDISHSLHGLVSGAYGTVMRLMRRPVRAGGHADG